MLPSSRELILDSAIIRMFWSKQNNRLLVYTNSKDLTFIDLNKLNITKTIPLSSEKSEVFDYYHRPVAMKSELAYIKLSPQGKEYIINIKDKIKKEVIFNYNANTKITKAHFSEDSRYLVIGNEIGRTQLIDTSSGELVYAFPYFTDCVSAVAISPQNKYVVTASFDKSISILNVDLMQSTNLTDIDGIVEMIQFIDDKTFLLITRDSRVIKIDANDKLFLAQTKLSDTIWPSEICVSHSKKFVYVGSRESVLYALHVNTLDVLFSVELNQSGITSLVRTHKYFIVGFKTGEIRFFNHRELEDSFVLNIQLKKIKEAIDLFENNIFLMSHRETSKIFDIWTSQKDSIIQLMSNAEIKEAQTLAKDFLFHPKCKQEMIAIEELQPELMSLQRYIRSKEYNCAYELVERCTVLKSTILYEKLEEIWKKALSKAQILLSREPILNKAVAREELSKFINVDIKKDLIEGIIRNSSIFARATTAVKNKNFTLYFKLVNENNFLKETPLYKKVIGLAEKIKSNIFNLLKEANYISALESAKLLNQFLPFSQDSKNLENFINSLILIDYHMRNKNLLESLKIQSTIKINSTYEPIIKLENMKKAFVKNLLLKIKNKSIEDIFVKIESYLEIDIFEREISMIMKHLYLVQIEKAFQENKEAVDWAKTLDNYILYFNLDKLILDLHEKLNMKFPLKESAKQEGDKNRKFVKNIIIYK